jgi:hypothetical protein
MFQVHGRLGGPQIFLSNVSAGMTSIVPIFVHLGVVNAFVPFGDVLPMIALAEGLLRDWYGPILVPGALSRSEPRGLVGAARTGG